MAPSRAALVVPTPPARDRAPDRARDRGRDATRRSVANDHQPWTPPAGAGPSPSLRTDPDRPHTIFYVLMPVLFALTIVLCAGVIALMVAPAIIGADATVKGINEPCE